MESKDIARQEKTATPDWGLRRQSLLTVIVMQTAAACEVESRCALWCVQRPTFIIVSCVLTAIFLSLFNSLFQYAHTHTHVVLSSASAK